MRVRVGLPTSERFVAEGRVEYDGGEVSNLRIESEGSKDLWVGYAVFKPSPTGKPFGRFHKERWELVGKFKDLQEAHSLAKAVKGTYRRWVEGWGGVLSVWADGRRIRTSSPFRFRGTVKAQVWVGRGFHWQRVERAVYEGAFYVYAWGREVKVVLELPLEEYVAGVISSELHPEAPLEALKAQAVASRTNLVRTAGKHHPNEPYDICAEDHCQVFRGLHILGERSRRASYSTSGEILLFEGEPIEARYSKSCGGITETFSVVWAEEDRPYSPSFRDWKVEDEHDASSIEGFERFYEVTESFCNVTFHPVENLYRWEEFYTREEMDRLLRDLNVGRVVELNPLRRGRSGRIYELEVVGEKGRVILGGEYNIRQTLGKPFLPSSAFVIKIIGKGFLLKGMGWGHGVGMCQMGAVGMAKEGYDYHRILTHYYKGAVIGHP